MPLRMLQIVLPRGKERDVAEIFADIENDRYWSADIDDNLSQVSVVLPSEHVEEVVDSLSEQFSVYSEFRVVVLAIEATRPKLPDPEPPPDPPREEPEQPTWKPLIGRISREELEEDLAQDGRTSAFFMVMVVLSTIVACVGLIKNSPAIIIGAMVIAPLLGPNMSLALATTLGDTKLIRQSVRSNAVGVVIALAMAAVIGLIIPCDPSQHELASRASVDIGDVALAIASGAAGALAATVGTSGTLVGVMVAVALLPPTCACGLFIGSGLWSEAASAAHLLAVNVVCINIAAKAVFLIQRIRPTRWWEAKRAAAATKRAVVIWIVLLLIVVALLYLEREVV